MNKLIFLEWANKIFQNKSINKEINKLRKGVPYKTRKRLEDLIESIDTNTEEHDAKVMTLIFLLHSPKIKKGNTDQIIRELIKQTEINFDEANITRIHSRLKEVLTELGLPELTINRNLIKNIAEYSETFRVKYKSIIRSDL